jgi:hypothetical protein
LPIMTHRGSRWTVVAGLLLGGFVAEAQAAGTGRDYIDVRDDSDSRRIEVYEVPSVRSRSSRSVRTSSVRPWWDIYDDPVALRRDLRAAWFLGLPVTGPSGYGAYGRLGPGRTRGAYASQNARTIRQYPRPYETQRPWTLRSY